MNINIRGDIELRFLNDADLRKFLYNYSQIEICQEKITIARKPQAGMINLYRYAVQFFVYGGIEL